MRSSCQECHIVLQALERGVTSPLDKASYAHNTGVFIDTGMHVYCERLKVAKLAPDSVHCSRHVVSYRFLVKKKKDLLVLTSISCAY